MNRFLVALLVFMTVNIVNAQQRPAKVQQKPVAIQNATIHVGNGKLIEKGIITFEKGKILSIGTETTLLKGYEVIDAKGKHVYPGFIAPNTQVGLTEIDAVRATRDFREVGQYNPNVRSIIAYNTDSRVTPTLRSNGVLLTQITPVGGVISGMSSVVNLDAWNWEDAIIRADDGIHLNWPRAFRRTGWWAQPGPIKKNKKYQEHVTKVKDFLKEAKAYSEVKVHKQKNLKFEAMRGLFDQSKSLYVHVSYAKSILESISACKEFGVKMVIIGGEDAWRVAETLKSNEIPVILANTQRLPDRIDEDIDQPFKTPNLLEKAGVLYCFSMNGGWEQRNLPFQAGQAVSYGLPYEKAIQALTSNTAKILGIDKQLGTLEVGKDATLIISEGEVLDMRTSKVEQAFIQGRAIDLDNKQKALYRKFKTKYQQEQK